VLHPTVERIVVCEIEPLIPPAAARFFGKENHRLLDDPRVEVVYDDARHFVATTSERFDIVTSDPIHPWVKGAAALYSQEYFELCRQRLNAGGIVTQWVPLYETNEAAVRSELATFFQVFPNGTIWGNDVDGDGYDLVVLGQGPQSAIDADALQARLEQADYGPVTASLSECGLGSALGLLSTYAGRGEDLRPWLQHADINRDRDLRLQYLAGLGLNKYDADVIYQSMIAFRRYPEDLFVARGVRGRALRQVIQGRSTGN
jgi:spermidine synthase